MPDIVYHIALPDGSERQVNSAEIARGILNGTITADTPLWCPGWNEWRRCGTLPEFLHLFTPVMAPPPSPCQIAPQPRKKGKKAKVWWWIIGIALVIGSVPIHGYIEKTIAKDAEAERTEETGNGQKQAETLFIAAAQGDTKTLSKLLKNGVSPNFKIEGITPLMAACTEGKIACVKLLLKHGADYSMHYGNSTKTALYSAVQKDKSKCLKLLLEAGADPNERYVEEGNSTPLMHACYLGHISCVRALIQAGADVNARTIDGVTPVRIAGGRGDTACLYLLQDAGGKY